MKAVFLEADAIPVFEHAWLFDHFNPIQGDLDGPCFEGWTTLAALAAVTNRIRVGLMVAGNTYRHPAVHAHMAATVDVLSGGRVDFGVGAGWNVYEHESMGLPLYGTGERIRRLGEACEITKRLFTQHLTDFDGRYYQLKEARLEPKPIQKPYPPFVIGGAGEQLTLRVVAQYADVWNSMPADVAEFQRKRSILDEHCAVVGRNPADIENSTQARVNYDDMGAVRCRHDSPHPADSLSLSRGNRRPPCRGDRSQVRLVSGQHTGMSRMQANHRSPAVNGNAGFHPGVFGRGC
jgi:F420-dependent oxidoreductase-like protein